MTKLYQYLRNGLVSLGLAAASALIFAAPAKAEPTVSVYGGASFSPHAGVDFDPGDGIQRRVTPKWDAKNFEMPPYYGVRATWWLESMPQIGLAVDFTHAKAAAEPLPRPFTVLEFTDGVNFLTANLIYRHQMEGRFTPYIGAGAGLAIPHVEATIPGFTQTAEYQITGIAAQAFIGVDTKITDNWSVFGEYKAGYAQIDADLQGGGNLDTHVISHQFLVGVTFRFY